MNLTPEFACSIHDTDDYPDVCRNLRADREMCGDSREDAIAYLERLEALTKPAPRGAGAAPPGGDSPRQ